MPTKTVNMTEKIRVVFSRNKDKKTANMFIDNFLIDEDIPFIPSLAMDHRGTALYFYTKENGLVWADVELDEFTEHPSEVGRAFEYMHKPWLIREAIQESNYQRRQQRRINKYN